jgi:hypothetical protein
MTHDWLTVVPSLWKIESPPTNRYNRSHWTQSYGKMTTGGSPWLLTTFFIAAMTSGSFFLSFSFRGTRIGCGFNQQGNKPIEQYTASHEHRAHLDDCRRKRTDHWNLKHASLGLRDLKPGDQPVPTQQLPRQGMKPYNKHGHGSAWEVKRIQKAAVVRHNQPCTTIADWIAATSRPANKP